MTGWGLVDVLLVAARGPSDSVVTLIMDAAAAPGLSVSRYRLAAVDASVTVRLDFAMAAARAAASELALRAAAALAVRDGSKSVMTDQHAQRLAREALFLLVFASPPPVKAALLGRLGALLSGNTTVRSG